MKEKFSARRLCRAGVIAALYVALSYLVQPFAFGAVQMRLSEALTVLPLFFYRKRTCFVCRLSAYESGRFRSL